LKVNPTDAKSIRSIFLYLNKRGEINRIHRWLGETDQKVLEQAIKNKEVYSLNSIFINEEIDLSNHEIVTIHFRNDSNFIETIPFSIKGFDDILHLNFFYEEDDLDTTKTIFISQNTILHIKQANDSLYSLDFSNKINNLINYLHQNDSLLHREDNSNIQLLEDRDKYHSIPSDSMIITMDKDQLLINNLHVRQIDSIYTLIGLDGYLLKKK
jgi:hypothetical protein